MKRAFGVVLSSSLLLPAGAYALGLGEIAVHSALNQPFLADVALRALNGVAPEDIQVQLANAETFARADIPRPHYLTQLSFIIDRDNQGHPVVRIRTTQRFNEPYLQFFIDIGWDEGRFSRLYTVLLDPPEFHIDTSVAKVAEIVDKSPVIAPVMPTRAKPQASQKPLVKVDQTRDDPFALPNFNDASMSLMAALSIPSSTKPLRIKPDELQPQIVQVHPGDDLSHIAKRLASKAGVNMHQAMVGIFNQNPKAFNRKNMNSLKAGAKLNIPSPEAMQALLPKEAEVVVNRHAKQWHGERVKRRAHKVRAVVKAAADPKPLADDEVPTIDMKLQPAQTAELSQKPMLQLALAAQSMPESRMDSLTLLASVSEANRLTDQPQQALIKRQDQDQDQQLQQQLINSQQIESVQGVAGSAGAALDHPSPWSNPRWLFAAMLLGALGGASGVYFWLRRQLLIRDAATANAELAEAYVTDPLEGQLLDNALSAKLDLATAYINMGDFVEARDLLEDVQALGNLEQSQEAQRLLTDMPE